MEKTLEDFAGEVRDTKKILEFKVLVDYKKFDKILKERGPIKTNWIPGSMHALTVDDNIIKNEFNFVLKSTDEFYYKFLFPDDNLSALTTEEPDKVALFIERMRQYTEEKAKTMERCLAYSYKLETQKINDGKNNSHIHGAVQFFTLKDSETVKRSIRQKTKEAVEKMYTKWRLTKGFPTLNCILYTIQGHFGKKEIYINEGKVLPTRMLQQLIDQKITPEDFCEKLFEIRQKEADKKFERDKDIFAKRYGKFNVIERRIT